MAEVVRRSDLVVSLATVAISALSAPLGAVGVAAAKELVKTCQSAWDRDAPDRQLRDVVQRSIEAWARGESIAAEVVDRGLGWAVEYVQAAGSGYDTVAKADFDPVQATKAVVDQVKASDRYWGTDAEYAVAERAINATYSALCKRLRSEGGVLLAAIQQTRQVIEAKIKNLHDELVGVAHRGELIQYLEKKTNLWDFSPWTDGKSPSLLERKLQIDTGDESRKPFPASEALVGVWLLVVLGGPGSGKSWLAQRYVREAADAALERLRDPLVDPGSVELPLLTSWAAWAAIPGGGVDALTAAALPVGCEDRIRRWVLRPGARVLAVADSLDEAGVGENATRTLLRSLTVPPGWRVVITSRPEAWYTTSSALATAEGIRIGTLVGLEYPNDVREYIQQWFATEPLAAQHLIAQIETRDELRETATVPLLLTFFCILTEQAPGQALPWRRRDLYRDVIDRLLTRRWSGEEPELDLGACREVLQSWAWEAVRDAVTPEGLGAWPDECTTGKAPKGLEKAVDSVASKQKYPTQSKYDHTHVERRFLHRTLLEQSVAEQIATFPAAKAADVLLPHVWFDPDWAVTVPMAIAAHPERDQVVDRLWVYHCSTPTRAQKIVNAELESVLLDVATQTFASDWSPAHRDLIDGLRVKASVSDPEKVLNSAHWTSSNTQTVHAILGALRKADPDVIGDLVEVLPALVVTETDRARVRREILEALPRADKDYIHALVDALPALLVTEADRASALRAILGGIPTIEGWVIRELVGDLVVSDADRAIVREAIVDALSTAEEWAIGGLVSVLPAVVVTEADRASALQAVLDVLPTTGDAVGALAGALPALVVTDAERASARQTIVDMLPPGPGPDTGDLIGALLALVVTDAERASVRQAIVDALRTEEGWAASHMVGALLTLDPTETDRVNALQAIVDTLRTADTWLIDDLVSPLLKLVVTDTDRASALQGIRDALPNANYRTVGDLVGALLELVVTDTDRASARQAILDALPNANRGAIGQLIGTLLALDPTDTDRASALTAILGALPTAEHWVIGNLVSALDLVVTETDRALARQGILHAVPTTNGWAVLAVVHALPALTDTEQAISRQLILDALPTATPQAVHALVGALLALDPTDTDRASARQVILDAVPTTEKWLIGNLVAALLDLVVTDADRASVRQVILNALLIAKDPEIVRDLVGGLRTLTTVFDWLGLLQVP